MEVWSPVPTSSAKAISIKECSFFSKSGGRKPLGRIKLIYLIALLNANILIYEQGLTIFDFRSVKEIIIVNLHNPI
jgi:hypothetical protein